MLADPLAIEQVYFSKEGAMKTVTKVAAPLCRDGRRTDAGRH